VATAESGLPDKSEDAVPVVLDQNTAMYSLQLYRGIGEEFEVTYDDGQTIRFVSVGLLANSILQGSLLISERNFVQRYRRSAAIGLLDPVAAEPVPAENNSLAPILRREGWVRGVFFGRAQVPAGRQRVRGRLSDQGFDAVSAYARLADLLPCRIPTEHVPKPGCVGTPIGTFGLAAVQARNVLERRRELALLRAVGFRLASLARLVMLENIGLLVGGLATGAVPP